MLTFENYIFNFHVWLHDLAAATPQREPAFSQARETIISIGRFTKMFNLLLNCWFHFMKHFSKPLQNARNRQNELVTGKSFWLLQWRSIVSWWACKSLLARRSTRISSWRSQQAQSAGMPQAQSAGMPEVLQPFTKPTWHLNKDITHSPSQIKMPRHIMEGTGGSNWRALERGNTAYNYFCLLLHPLLSNQVWSCDTSSSFCFVYFLKN